MVREGRCEEPARLVVDGGAAARHHISKARLWGSALGVEVAALRIGNLPAGSSGGARGVEMKEVDGGNCEELKWAAVGFFVCLHAKGHCPSVDSDMLVLLVVVAAVVECKQ